MLQGIRKHLKGWAAGVIFGVITLTFMLWGVESYLQEQHQNKAVATINGASISMQQLRQAVRQVRYNSRQKINPKVVLNELIRQKKTQKVVDRLGFVLGPRQTVAYVQSLPYFKVDGQFSQSALLRYVTNQRLTLSEFYQQQAHNFAQMQLENGVVGSAFTLPKELQSELSLSEQTRTFSVMTLPMKSIIDSVKITQSQVQQFYDNHKAQFVVPAQYRFSYILLSPTALQERAAVSEAQAKQYYQANLQRYTQPKRWYVERLLLTLPKNPTQSDVTRIEAAAKKIQPTLKTKSWDSLVNQAKRQRQYTKQWVFSLQVSGKLLLMLSSLEPNQVSQPFITREGFNFFRVIKLQAAKVSPFSEVKPQIIKMLTHQKVAAMFNEKSQDLSNLVFSSPDTLQTAAKALGLKVMTSNWISRKGDYSGLFADPRVVALAFSPDVFDQHNNSRPISLKDASLLVVRFKDKKPESQKPLKQVAQQIKLQLQKEQAIRMAGVKAHEIMQQLKRSPSSLKRVAKKQKLSWKTFKQVNRYNKTVSAEILQSAFSMKTGQFSSVLTPAGDYGIIHLDKIDTGTHVVQSLQQMSKSEQALSVAYGKASYYLYMAGAIKSIKAKTTLFLNMKRLPRMLILKIKMVLRALSTNGIR